MNDQIQRIKSLFRGMQIGFLDVVGGSPKRYWTAFVFAIFMFLLAVFFLDGVVFWRNTEEAFKAIYVAEGMITETINRQGLDEMSDMFKRRTERSDAVLVLPMGDPSR